MGNKRQKIVKFTLMLFFIVIVSVLSGRVLTVASGPFAQLNQSNEQVFFTQLDRDLTIEQAVSAYPAILGYFPIEKASLPEPVDAKTLVVDVSTVNAYDLLSNLNARKGSATDIQIPIISSNKIMETRSNGAAWPHTPVYSQNVTCYGYAINENIF